MKKYVVTQRQPTWSSWHITLKTKVYGVIRSSGDTGADRREFAAATNLGVGRVSTYLAELKREGLVKHLSDHVDQSTLNAKDSAFYALDVLENALVTKARECGITSDMERAFVRYQKIKALALRPTTDGEAQTALRTAVIELVKLVY